MYRRVITALHKPSVLVFRETVQPTVAELDVPLLYGPRVTIPPLSRDVIWPRAVDYFAMRPFRRDKDGQVMLKTHMRRKGRTEAPQWQAERKAGFCFHFRALTQLFKLRRHQFKT